MLMSRVSSLRGPSSCGVFADVLLAFLFLDGLLARVPEPSVRVYGEWDRAAERPLRTRWPLDEAVVAILPIESLGEIV